MPIMWTRFGPELKRRRDRIGLTQDALAAKAGVRWSTIARLEGGQRRPSLDLLERLAEALRCRIGDLLPEEERAEGRRGVAQRAPSLRGAPTAFRRLVAQAEGRGLPRDMAFARPPDYAAPGYELARRAGEHLSDEARAELERLARAKEPRRFARALGAFLGREFPGCLALVPESRRAEFMQGVLRAIEQRRFPVRYDVGGLIERELEE